MKKIMIGLLVSLSFTALADINSMTQVRDDRILFGSQESLEMNVRIARKMIAEPQFFKVETVPLSVGNLCRIKTLNPSVGVIDVYPVGKIYKVIGASEHRGPEVTINYINGSVSNPDWQPLIISCSSKKMTLKQVEEDLTDSNFGLSIYFE